MHKAEIKRSFSLLCLLMFFLFFFPDTLYFGELNEKIRLLYCLHIPPGYSLCEYDDELLSSTLMSAIY